MGKKVAPILRAAGISVKTYHEIFDDPMLADDVWLREVSRTGLVVLSHNRDMRYDPKAQDAIMEENGRLLVIRGQVRNTELAEIFVRARDSVNRLLQRQPAPFMGVVRRSPTKTDPAHTEVKLTLTHAQWSARR